MNKINTAYTLNYSQPKDYQFSLDSIQLAKWVADKIKDSGRNISDLKFLDLCAGCGVIGLEIYYYLREINHFDFLEIQSVYQDFFDKNLNLFDPRPNFRFINENYQNFNDQKYDLIVCNPPYFFKNEGVLSPNEFKNRCRFFLDSDFNQLIHSIERLLNPGGSAYILISDGNAHGRSRVEYAAGLLKDSKIIRHGKIRITNLVEITKN